MAHLSLPCAVSGEISKAYWKHALPLCSAVVIQHEKQVVVMLKKKAQNSSFISFTRFHITIYITWITVISLKNNRKFSAAMYEKHSIQIMLWRSINPKSSLQTLTNPSIVLNIIWFVIPKVCSLLIMLRFWGSPDLFS